MVRRRNKLFRYAIDTFIELVKQVTGQQFYNYRATDADTGAFENFTEHFGINIGEDFVRKFIEYQIQSWYNPSIDYDRTRQLRFTWMVGKGAIKRWEANDIKTNVAITRGCLKRNYKINVIKKESSLGQCLTTLRPEEEKMRGIFHNRTRGLVWCRANTTLYFDKSVWCSKCKYQIECKELLETNFPKVFKLRGYAR